MSALATAGTASVIWEIVKAGGSALTTGAKTGLTVYQHRETIKKIWPQIFGKKYRIAVTGAEGTGKSVLVDYLQGHGFERGYIPPDKSRKLERDRVYAPKTCLELRAVPGQATLVGRRDALADVFLGKEPLDGIVHVVSNGFLDPRRVEDPDALVAGGCDTLAKYVDLSRRVELQDWLEIAPAILWHWTKHRKPLWLVIAVAKVDLYQRELAGARGLYQDSEQSAFVRTMHELRQVVGFANLSAEVVPVSTQLDPIAWNGEELRPDLLPAERDAYVDQFARVLLRFCDG